MTAKVDESFLRKAFDDFYAAITGATAAQLTFSATYDPLAMIRQPIDLSQDPNTFPGNINGWVKVAMPVKACRHEGPFSAATAGEFKLVLMPEFQQLRANSAFATMRLNDTVNFGQISTAWITWDVQPGKTAEIVWGIDVQFQQGAQITEIQGQVFVGDGSLGGDNSTVAVDNTPGGTLVLPVDGDRVRAIIQNPDENLDGSDPGNGNVLLLFTGDGDTDGVLLTPGREFEYRGTAAVRAISGATPATLRKLVMKQ